MTPPELQGAVVVGVVLTVIAGVAGFVWYAIALSRLFPKIGGEAWKGWVPVLNEAEILTRGGIPGWSVVYYFIPVLQLYGVYLKAVALLRINRKLGRGAGLTVVGLLFPPIWASILGWGRVTTDVQVAAGVASSPPVRGDRVASPRVKPEPTLGVRVTDASGYAIPQKPPSAPAQISAAEAPVAPAQPALSVAPAPPDEPAVPLPPNAVSVSPAVPVVAAEPQAVDVRVVPPVEPVSPVLWSLRLDDGRAFALTATRVELGRNPSSDDAASQLLAIEDSTRTLSKAHARLTFGNGQWTITDLKSTNGVMVVAADGAENYLEPAASAVVQGRFVLGDVGMSVSSE